MPGRCSRKTASHPNFVSNTTRSNFVRRSTAGAISTSDSSCWIKPRLSVGLEDDSVDTQPGDVPNEETKEALTKDISHLSWVFLCIGQGPGYPPACRGVCQI